MLNNSIFCEKSQSNLKINIKFIFHDSEIRPCFSDINFNFPFPLPFSRKTWPPRSRPKVRNNFFKFSMVERLEIAWIHTPIERAIHVAQVEDLWRSEKPFSVGKSELCNFTKMSTFFKMMIVHQTFVLLTSDERYCICTSVWPTLLRFTLSQFQGPRS